jgi:hypothetical protein
MGFYTSFHLFLSIYNLVKLIQDIQMFLIIFKESIIMSQLYEYHTSSDDTTKLYYNRGLYMSGITGLSDIDCR